jgi:hypothetical protein
VGGGGVAEGFPAAPVLVIVDLAVGELLEEQVLLGRTADAMWSVRIRVTEQRADATEHQHREQDVEGHEQRLQIVDVVGVYIHQRDSSRGVHGAGWSVIGELRGWTAVMSDRRASRWTVVVGDRRACDA